MLERNEEVVVEVLIIAPHAEVILTIVIVIVIIAQVVATEIVPMIVTALAVVVPITITIPLPDIEDIEFCFIYWYSVSFQ